MKYEKQPIVQAIYTECPEGRSNPLLEAMPPMLDKETVMDSIASFPVQVDINDASIETRLTLLTDLSTYFYPMDYMYAIYTSLYRAIRTTYINQTMLESIRRICDTHNMVDISNATQGESGSILGVPGVGKSSTVRRSLALMPHVIEHTMYKDEPFFSKQILWLFVDCPSDCSVKALASNIISAIERAVGHSINDSVFISSHTTMAALSRYARIACANYHIGIIVIDEIQNVVSTSSRLNQKTSLIQFLLELTNAAGTAIWMIGTPIAEDVFLSKDHLKRRTRGMRLLPFKPDGVYRGFLETLWQFQYTQRHAELTDSLANLLYDRSGGIPAYIVQLFKESQGKAILDGNPCIGTTIINETAKLLSIQVPQSYVGGTSISDICQAVQIQNDDGKQTIHKREYATQRGRKPTRRDERDIIAMFKLKEPIMERLRELGMVEVL